MNKKLFNAFLFVIFFPVLLNAQSVLTGIVRDSAGQLPLQGAVVSVSGSFNTAITTNEGSFQIKLPTGKPIAIQIRLLGYELLIDTLVLNSNEAKTFILHAMPFLQNEVLISATRANEKTGFAFTNLDKKEIEAENNGKDIPYLLLSTPSLVATSDAGTGIGYTGVRIRGSDATRINVTLNGIPMNDAESQQLYWVDLPDLASSTDNIQVQRGVGTSTNGAGAFGGSINILSSNPEKKPFASSSNSYGSFNTVKNNLSFGTGMIDNKWNVEGRLSRITSDGYIDRTTSDLRSFFITGGYYSKKDLVKCNILSGREITYQAWLGVPEYALDTNRTLNLYTYNNQVDNYGQDHYQLFWSHSISTKFSFNTALHYTKGSGYYEEYEEGQLLSDYLLQDVISGNDTVSETNLVRRKWLDNDFYGGTWSLNYEPSVKTSIIFGGAWNRYEGDHFGKVIWAQFASNATPDYEYYRDNATKTDFNSFLKATLTVGDKCSLYGDMQIRSIHYAFTGITSSGNQAPMNDNLLFFNPKAGINYTINNNHSLYASAAVAGKEPSRDDYVDNPENVRPGAEELLDIEAGYHYSATTFSATVNLYNMQYRDQLVVTGRLNDVGNPVRINIDKSHRTGAEFIFGWAPVSKLKINGHATFSSNIVDSYNETVYNYDNGDVIDVPYSNTNLAYSPNITGGSEITYLITDAFNATLSGNYVGKQYLDNTSNDLRKLDPYFVSNLRLNYDIQPKFMKGISLAFWINNLFDELYESNGYTYSYIYGGAFITENFYYPQAGRNYTVQLTLKF
ncbi:MAG TPA: TonB-dependent receptor [Bacteroidia bacterium]|nr:TonB-dependent receptor [Bacteroidia bacterium]